LYLWLNCQRISGTGTTQQQLTVPDFSKSKILVPDLEIIETFTKAVDQVFLKIDFNKTESRILAAIRDALLPKLMSGEIEVGEDL
jgi:type I restriction enzyme S subunit